MIGKQTVELQINSEGKRTVVVLNPSFFYFFNPFFVMGYFTRAILFTLLQVILIALAYAQGSSSDSSSTLVSNILQESQHVGEPGVDFLRDEIKGDKLLDSSHVIRNLKNIAITMIIGSISLASN